MMMMMMMMAHCVFEQDRTKDYYTISFPCAKPIRNTCSFTTKNGSDGKLAFPFEHIIKVGPIKVWKLVTYIMRKKLLVFHISGQEGPIIMMVKYEMRNGAKCSRWNIEYQFSSDVTVTSFYFCLKKSCLFCEKEFTAWVFARLTMGN